MFSDKASSCGAKVASKVVTAVAPGGYTVMHSHICIRDCHAHTCMHACAMNTHTCISA